MKHAFLIIAHNEPEVLSVLLECLDDERNDIFLHIDKRATEMQERFASYKPRYSSFYLLEDALAVYWGDISQVKVELKLFRTAHEHGEYAFYHLLSGVDLPLKTMDELHAFFNRYSDREFVSFWEGKQHQKDLRRKVRYYYPFTRHQKDKGTVAHRLLAPLRNISLLLQKAVGFSRRHRCTFRKGSNWVSITHGFCSYLIGYEEDLLKRYRMTLCADEIFLQTALHNSPFCAQRYRNEEGFEEENLRKIDWQRGHPYVWQEKDFEELMASPALFARKFSGKEPLLLSRIKGSVLRA